MSRITHTTRRRRQRMIALAAVVVAVMAAPLSAVADEADASIAETADAQGEAETMQEAPAGHPAEEARPQGTAVASGESVAVDGTAEGGADAAAAGEQAVEGAVAGEAAEHTQGDRGAGEPRTPGVDATEESGTGSDARPQGAGMQDPGLQEVGPQDAGPNRAPIANDDHYEVSQDTVLVVGEPGGAGHDGDPAGAGVPVTHHNAPMHGTLTTINAMGPITYAPAPGFVGTDTFEYWLRDAAGLESEHATVTIEVKPTGAPVVLPPVAVADAYTYAVSTPLYIAPAVGLLGNDDLHGDAGAASLEFLPSGWGVPKVAVNPDGSFLMTPEPNVGGTRWFRYRVCTLGGCGIGMVMLNQAAPGEQPSGPSEAPVDQGPGGDATPMPHDDDITVVAGQTVSLPAPGVLADDEDADGDALTVLSSGTTPFGSLSIDADGALVYVADSDFVGTVHVPYTVTDGKATATATVHIEVTAAEDACVGPSPTVPLPAGCDPVDQGTLDGPGAAGSGETDAGEQGGAVIGDGPARPVSATGAATLAQTGSDPAAAAVTGIAALALGAALIGIRRRTARA